MCLIMRGVQSKGRLSRPCPVLEYEFFKSSEEAADVEKASGDAVESGKVRKQTTGEEGKGNR